MKVLYVEDNPANVFLVKRVARMGNHEIINYIDGNQALGKFAEIEPDLVLMDIQLAGDKSGLDVVKELRARGVETPIIAVTAYAMVGDKERCLAAGCDDYLAKPLPIPRLVEIFKSYSESAAGKSEKADDKKETITETKTEPVTAEKTETPAEPEKAGETKVESVTPEKAESVITPEPEKTETPVAKTDETVAKTTETPADKPQVTDDKAETATEASATASDTTSTTSEADDKAETATETTQPEASAPETASTPVTDSTEKQSETSGDADKTGTSVQNELANNTTSADTDSNVAEIVDNVKEIPTGE